MYTAIILALLAVAAVVAVVGVRRDSSFLVAAGIALGLAVFGLFSVLDFWGEVLWFDQLGYADRLWIEIGAATGVAAAAAALAGLLVFVLTLPVPRHIRIVRIWPECLAAFLGAVWGARQWETVLAFWHREMTGVTDPMLGHDVGFYLFTLPFLEGLQQLLLPTVLIAGAAVLVAVFSHRIGDLLPFRIRMREGTVEIHPASRTPQPTAVGWALPIVSATLALVVAYGQLLGLFGLLFSRNGATFGPGWTDVHIRHPAYWVTIAATLLFALLMLVPTVRRRIGRRLVNRFQGMPADLLGLAALWAGVIAVAFVSLQAAPGLLQWLRVEPNEISFERPYIANNIEFTLRGFGLDDVEEREFPAEAEFTQSMAAENEILLDEIRLWDAGALDSVYRQFQEIRLYYEFADIDIDRYRFGDRYRQVMVSARELEIGNLPPQSQSFVNRRFKYSHGYGLTLAPVSDFTPDGLPNLLIRDIPPVSEFPELEIDRPEIYFGELTDEPVVVNSEEAEFDYPRGDENVYVRYEGDGGVPIETLWRRFLFGWKFDGTRLLLSDYPKQGSRIMFHRRVQRRVQRLAPFLRFDDDPYVVLADGRQYWMIDAYTASGSYPYSTPYSSREVVGYEEGGMKRSLVTRSVPYLHGANYVRNSVKIVVDAYSGDVDFYVFEPDDPLIRVWRRIYPGLFQPRSEMPEELESHIRYPQSLLLAQGLVYAKYHMTDPTVFYNQEDLWVRATEKYYGDLEPVAPYYVMWERAQSDTSEFAAILPFTPKSRQVLIGWIAGLCDPPNYGTFLAYKFPKEKWILGPQQVETKIDQDRNLSSQLTLWDQRGSNVLRGNVLAIPIDEALLYVEPIYLQADTAAYPELRLVIVMHGDNLAYGQSFDQALARLFGTEEPPPPTRIERGPRPETEQADATEGEVEPGSAVPTPGPLAREAGEALERYQRLQGEGRFEEAGRALDELRGILEEMTAESGG